MLSYMSAKIRTVTKKRKVSHKHDVRVQFKAVVMQAVDPGLQSLLNSFSTIF